MSYLLDTNACIAAIKGDPPHVQLRLGQETKQGVSVAVSSIVTFELWYGAFKSGRRQANMERLELFLTGPIDLLPFDDRDARVAGEIRATLKAAGAPIGPYDMLIAGQALRSGMTLVTANTSEFSRVEELRWEDWASQQ